MANTDYTEAQLKAHLTKFKEDGTLPDGSIFDPSAETRGGPILRKMTADERRDAGLKPSSDATEPKGD